MGRRKKIPELDRIDGNPSNRPALVVEVEGIGSVFVPDHLPDEAAAVVEIVKEMMPDKVYSAVDSYLLSAFAMQWYVHRQVSHMISDPLFAWSLETTQGELKVNPWVKELPRQALALASLGDRLGLDPKSRAALRLPEEKPRSKFDGLLGQNELSPSSNASSSQAAKGRAGRLN